MSGPKSGLMKIESYRLAQLQAQRDRNTKIVKDACRKAHDIVDGVTRRAGAMGAWGENELQRCVSMTSQLEARFARLASEKYPDEVMEAVEYNDWLEKKLNGELDDFRRRVDDISLGMRDAEGAYLRQEDRTKRAMEFVENLDVKQTKSCTSLLSSVDLVLRRLQDLKESAGDVRPLTDLLDRASKQRAAFQQLALSGALSERHLAALMKYVDDLKATADAYAAHPEERLLEMRGRLNIGESLISHFSKEVALVEDLYNECRALKARCDALDMQSTDLPPLWQMTDANMLSQLRDTLYKEADCAARNAYIAHAIDEVMTRHGYNVKRSVQLASLANSQGAFPHSLYLDESQGTAIHVAVSPQRGAVMMETALYGPGLAEGPDGMVIERVAVQGEWERRQLVMQQQQFCTLFGQLSQELAEYGVVLNKTADKPASESNSVSFQTYGQSIVPSQAAQGRRRTGFYENENLVERQAE